MSAEQPNLFKFEVRDMMHYAYGNRDSPTRSVDYRARTVRICPSEECYQLKVPIVKHFEGSVCLIGVVYCFLNYYRTEQSIILPLPLPEPPKNFIEWVDLHRKHWAEGCVSKELFAEIQRLEAESQGAFRDYRNREIDIVDQTICDFLNETFIKERQEITDLVLGDAKQKEIL